MWELLLERLTSIISLCKELLLERPKLIWYQPATALTIFPFFLFCFPHCSTQNKEKFIQHINPSRAHHHSAPPPRGRSPPSATIPRSAVPDRPAPTRHRRPTIVGTLKTKHSQTLSALLAQFQCQTLNSYRFPKSDLTPQLPTKFRLTALHCTK